jgi:hypothetical protein
MDERFTVIIRRDTIPERRIDFQVKPSAQAEDFELDTEPEHDPCGRLQGIDDEPAEINDERLLRNGELILGDGVDDKPAPSPGTSTPEDDIGGTASVSESNTPHWGSNTK